MPAKLVTYVRIRVLLLLALAMGAFWTPPAQAQTSTQAASQTVLQRMQQFSTTVNTKVRYVVENPRYYRATRVLFITFALFTLATVFVKLGFEGWGRNVPFLVERLALVYLTSAMLFGFSEWTHAVDAMFRGFGEIIQVAMTGDEDPFAPAFRLMLAAESIQFDTGYSMLDWGANATVLWSVLLTVLLLLVLCAVTAGASLWAFWGFTILKLIGPIFVPFLLFDRLSGWFDAWFNLFAGFLLYAMLLGVSLNLAAFAFYAGLGLADTHTPPGTAPIVVGSFWELLPMIVFAGISVFGIYKCGAIASQITSSGGGLAANVRGLATWAGNKFA